MSSWYGPQTPRDTRMTPFDWLLLIALVGVNVLLLAYRVVW